MTAERLYDILSKYAESQGVQLNKDKEFVLEFWRDFLQTNPVMVTVPVPAVLQQE